ncbi:hypothetical protein ACMU_14045 [Actibacterium mucosum KCTC 23349]|uniref:HTH lysR-type domain-containing protein n=1 Tax=Actibacterium mucosum KCTC 23349 TaxID=1454373 RepID=A0A037ZJA5_9RHOB|nr:hypothetical protein ACMU_14045 [Actibacterium mucosum KCTC 23349]
MDWRNLPPLAALRAFAAFAERGNVTEAGAALNVSHAAISQQIRQLEEVLGRPLVDRSARALTLTAEGRQLAAGLVSGFQQISDMVEHLRGDVSSQPVRVATTPTFASNWLVGRLAQFRADCPGIDVVINPSSQIEKLGPGGHDLAIRFGRGNWAGLDSTLLLHSDYVIAASPDLIGDTVFTDMTQVAQFPWLLEDGHKEMENWLASEGMPLSAHTDIARLPGFYILDAMRRGEGIAGTSRTFVEADIAAGRLRVLFTQSDPNSGYHLVTPRGVLRPATQAFATWIKRRVRQERAT